MGTSGHRSVLDLVLPVITISTAEFLLVGLSLPAEEAPIDGWLLEMFVPLVYGLVISCNMKIIVRKDNVDMREIPKRY